MFDVIKTTRTAPYAAVAAKISCLLALVSIETQTEKIVIKQAIMPRRAIDPFTKYNVRMAPRRKITTAIVSIAATASTTCRVGE
jgi:hypothetical protein